MGYSNEQPKPRRSFSNGNMPDVTELPLEGWVIRPVHWWYN